MAYPSPPNHVASAGFIALLFCLLAALGARGLVDSPADRAPVNGPRPAAILDPGPGPMSQAPVPPTGLLLDELERALVSQPPRVVMASVSPRSPARA